MSSSQRERPTWGDGRSALIEAAIRVVSRAGLRGLTIRKVAKEAGVTHGLVRHHFGSREGLLHEARKRAETESIGETLDASDEGLAAFEIRLPEFIALTEDLQAFQFELALESRRHPELIDDVREMYDSYHEAMARLLESYGLDATPGLVRAVFAACDGLAFQQLIYRDPVLTGEALDALRALLRQLVATAPTAATKS